MTQEKRKLHLAVLGSGFMGTSILKGLLKHSSEDDGLELSYTACVRSQSSLDRLQKALGENVSSVDCQIGAFVEASKKADVVMLGIPPGELDSFSQTPGLAEAVQDKLIVSLLAGVSCTQVAKAFTKGSDEKLLPNVTRVIPTIAAQVNDSVTIIADFERTDKAQRQLCTSIFRRIGATQDVPENLMNEATATGAVCHAIAISAVDAAVDASVAKGLPREGALGLAAHSLRSAAGLLGGEMTPEQLKAAMSVPCGITINSMLKLDRANLRHAVADTVGEAIDYARNMA